MPKKVKVMPKIGELKPLLRSFWTDAFEMKSGFEAMKQDEIDGDFGRFMVFKNRLNNLIVQLRQMQSLCEGKETKEE